MLAVAEGHIRRTEKGDTLIRKMWDTRLLHEKPLAETHTDKGGSGESCGVKQLMRRPTVPLPWQYAISLHENPPSVRTPE